MLLAPFSALIRESLCKALACVIVVAVTSLGGLMVRQIPKQFRQMRKQIESVGFPEGLCKICGVG